VVMDGGGEHGFKHPHTGGGEGEAGPAPAQSRLKPIRFSLEKSGRKIRQRITIHRLLQPTKAFQTLLTRAIMEAGHSIRAAIIT